MFIRKAKYEKLKTEYEAARLEALQFKISITQARQVHAIRLEPNSPYLQGWNDALDLVWNSARKPPSRPTQSRQSSTTKQTGGQ